MKFKDIKIGQEFTIKNKKWAPGLGLVFHRGKPQYGVDCIVMDQLGRGHVINPNTEVELVNQKGQENESRKTKARNNRARLRRQ